MSEHENEQILGKNAARLKILFELVECIRGLDDDGFKSAERLNNILPLDEENANEILSYFDSSLTNDDCTYNFNIRVYKINKTRLYVIFENCPLVVNIDYFPIKLENIIARFKDELYPSNPYKFKTARVDYTNNNDVDTSDNKLSELFRISVNFLINNTAYLKTLKDNSPVYERLSFINRMLPINEEKANKLLSMFDIYYIFKNNNSNDENIEVIRVKDVGGIRTYLIREDFENFYVGEDFPILLDLRNLLFKRLNDLEYELSPNHSYEFKIEVINKSKSLKTITHDLLGMDTIELSELTGSDVTKPAVKEVGATPNAKRASSAFNQEEVPTYNDIIDKESSAFNQEMRIAISEYEKARTLGREAFITKTMSKLIECIRGLADGFKSAEGLNNILPLDTERANEILSLFDSLLTNDDCTYNFNIRVYKFNKIRLYVIFENCPVVDALNSLTIETVSIVEELKNELYPSNPYKFKTVRIDYNINNYVDTNTNSKPLSTLHLYTLRLVNKIGYGKTLEDVAYLDKDLNLINKLLLLDTEKANKLLSMLDISFFLNNNGGNDENVEAIRVKDVNGIRTYLIHNDCYYYNNFIDRDLPIGNMLHRSIMKCFAELEKEMSPNNPYEFKIELVEDNRSITKPAVKEVNESKSLKTLTHDISEMDILELSVLTGSDVTKPAVKEVNDTSATKRASSAFNQE